MKDLIEEFKKSDEYQDLLCDGMLYHAVYWLKKHYPSIEASEFIDDLTKV